MGARRDPGRLQARLERERRHAATDDVEIVLAAAGRYLEQRARSVEEVRRHLRLARYPDALIEASIDRIVAAGMLDDRAFASAWVESRDRARPRGEQALRRELSLKGLDRDLIADVLAERAAGPAAGGTDAPDNEEPPDLRAALRLLEKRRSALDRIADPRLRRQRAYALLARNGFDPDVCRQASLGVTTNPGPGESPGPGKGHPRPG